MRHTVGLVDPVASLHSELSATGCRYFKLKLGGDPEKDHVRLAAIAEALEAIGADYRVTVDANEQYANVNALAALAHALSTADDLKEIAKRLLYIEQPLPREKTWDTPLERMGEAFAFIIDEADAHYGAFEQAQRLGYRGVSSKACKGLYKAILNGARSAQWNRERIPTFIAAEDLTCQAGPLCSRIPHWRRSSALPTPSATVIIMSMVLLIRRRPRRGASLMPTPTCTRRWAGRSC